MSTINTLRPRQVNQAPLEQRVGEPTRIDKLIERLCELRGINILDTIDPEGTQKELPLKEIWQPECDRMRGGSRKPHPR